MSDEESTAPGDETNSSGLDAITGRLSSPGELLLALGAALVVFVDLLGNVILEEYSFGRVPWVASLLILLAVAAPSLGRAAAVRRVWPSAGCAGARCGRDGRARASGRRQQQLPGRWGHDPDGADLLCRRALLLIGSWQSWSSDEGDA